MENIYTKVWLDKEIIDLSDAKIAIYDQGFLYGQGLFETMRSYNLRVFLLEEHIDRLINSCGALDIDRPDKNLLMMAAEETVKQNNLKSGYIRLNVWKKDKGYGIFVFAKDLLVDQGKNSQKSFRAILEKNIRQNETSPLANIKSLNHYFYISLTQKARNFGADETLILNTKGVVCEGARTNIFIVRDGIIFTPSIRSGCLPGITRQVVFDIANRNKLDIRGCDISPQDCFNSDEVFLTNSLIGVMPLIEIDGKKIAGGVQGPVTMSLEQLYFKVLEEHC